MASPHASGVAAIIRSRYPDMPPMAVGSMLQNTSMPMACTESAEARAGADCTGNTNPNAHGQTSFYGNGLVDALAAAVEYRRDRNPRQEEGRRKSALLLYPPLEGFRKSTSAAKSRKYFF